MIASSGPMAARSRIAEERVSMKSGPSIARAAAQVDGQRLLGILIQPLLNHIDDQHVGALGCQSDEQGCQRRGRHGALVNKPGEALLYATP